jgi:hypothetical protein
MPTTLRELITEKTGNNPDNLFFLLEDGHSTACWEFDGASFAESENIILLFDSELEVDDIFLSLDELMASVEAGQHSVSHVRFQVGQIKYF